MSKKLLLTALILGCFCYEEGNLKEKSVSQIHKTDLLKEADKIISYADSILKNGTYPQIRVFAEVEGTPRKFIEVENLDDWPENTITTINIVYDEDEKPVVYLEIIESESGDCYDGYCNYYSKKGKIVAFHRTASFYWSSCGEGVITEENRFYYDDKFNKISEQYELHDDSGMPIDSVKCGEIICRFDYEIYKTFSKTPLVKKGILK